MKDNNWTQWIPMEWIQKETAALFTLLRRGIKRADESLDFFARIAKDWCWAAERAFFPGQKGKLAGALGCAGCGLFVLVALCCEPALNRGIEEMLYPPSQLVAQAMARGNDTVWGNTVSPFDLDILMAQWETKQEMQITNGPVTVSVLEDQQVPLSLKSMGGTASVSKKTVLKTADIDWTQMQGADSQKASYFYNNVNSDTIGWLQIPQTNIDYPVVQGRTLNTYLQKDIFGNYSNDGVLWVDTSVSDYSNNIVIFGHNWTNVSGSPAIGRASDVMFAQLPSFANASFAAQVPYIYYSTTSKDYVWEVFAAFYTTDLKFYLYTDNSSSTQRAIVDKAKRLSLYDYGVSVSGEDRILTLSTCTRAIGGAGENQRFVVMAKLVG